MASQELSIILKAVDNASAEIKKIGGGIGDTLKKVSAAAAIAGGALEAAAVGIVKNFGDVGEELGKFTATTGTSAEAASVFKMATGAMGISLETVSGSIRKMQVNLAGFATDSKAAEAALGPLGLKLSDIKNLKPEEQFVKIGNAIGAINDPTARAAAGVAVFGKSAGDLQPIFEGGKFSMADMTAQAEKTGQLFNGEMVTAANNADNAFDSLTGTLEGTKNKLATALAPAITAVIEKLIPIIQQVTDWIAKNPELVSQIVQWTAAVLAVTAVIGPLITIVEALGVALAFLAANPVVIIIAAIVGLVAALKLAYDNSEDFRRIVNEVFSFAATFIGNAMSGISSGIQTAAKIWTGAWNGMYTGIKNIIDSILAAIDGMVQGIQNAYNTIKNTLSAITKATSSGVSSGVGTFANIGNSIGSALNLNNYRASGGPVTGGTPYIVGEQGPELFVPTQSGGIIPNGKFGGGGSGGVTLNFGDVNISKDVDSEAFFRQLENRLSRTLQLQKLGSI